MNLYYIDSGKVRFYAKKIDALRAAQWEANETGKEINVSKMYIAVDRGNVARMANNEEGFNRFVGRVCIVKPHTRPKLKLRQVAAVLSVFFLLLPNPSEASSCVTRRSGSVTITTCDGKNFYSQCRSYMSGKIRKTHCR